MKNKLFGGSERKVVLCPYCNSSAASPLNWSLIEKKPNDKMIITLECNACESIFIRTYHIKKIEEHTLKETNKNIIILLDLITKLEKKNSEKNVKITDLEKKAITKMDYSEFKKTLDKIYKNGEIFKPKPEIIRRLI